ncbi:MAG: NAD(P)-dependent oxidoreductase [Caulobacterales bacterium]|uniref:NAD(P)-dependent oxidoreductase n=1 Tax=Glycocaulis sp. TaxID=1969725 RepID=UPI003F9F4841
MSHCIVTAASLASHEAVIGHLSDAGCEILRLPADFPGWTPEILRDYAARADAFVGTFRGLGLPREALAAASSARVITSPIIGVEHIDVKAATELGIVVAHGAMAENFEGMAEAGVMLVAALRKNLMAKQASVGAGQWKTAAPGGLVSGSTVGFLGLGRIGRAIARRLISWDCDLIAHDPYVDATLAAQHGVDLVGFDALLERSDVLLVLVTLTPETRHIINAEALARMKPGACLINIGRGGCVDDDALLQALESGHLGAAAIDAWEAEPPAPDHPLRRHPRVIATAHDVGHSAELYARIPEVAAENTLRGLRGELPLHIANPGVTARWLARQEVLPG